MLLLAVHFYAALAEHVFAGEDGGSEFRVVEKADAALCLIFLRRLKNQVSLAHKALLLLAGKLHRVFVFGVEDHFAFARGLLGFLFDLAVWLWLHWRLGRGQLNLSLLNPDPQSELHV